MDAVRNSAAARPDNLDTINLIYGNELYLSVSVYVFDYIDFESLAKKLLSGSFAERFSIELGPNYFCRTSSAGTVECSNGCVGKR